MKRPITATILSVLAGFAFSAPTLADSPGTGAEEHKSGVKVEAPSFEETNSNKDNYIDMQEAKAAGVEEPEAKSADADDDGQLTAEEWSKVDATSNEDSESDSMEENN